MNNVIMSDRKGLVLKNNEFAIVHKIDGGIIAVFTSETIKDIKIHKDYSVIAGNENGEVVLLKPDKDKSIDEKAQLKQ